MLGTSGMQAKVYDDPLDTSDPASLRRHTDMGIDAQYQYLLDPHAVTAQWSFMRNHTRYSANQANQPVLDSAGNALANSNGEDTLHTLRAKLTYVYQAKYGGSNGLFNLTGSSNTAYLTAGFNPAGAPPSLGQVDGNRAGRPDTRGMTLEAFWTPVQNLRLGIQYTGYSQFNGAGKNYDGYGRNASDNNSLFLYAWLAY